MTDDTTGYPGDPDRLIHYIRDYSTYHNDNPKFLAGKVPQFQIDVIKGLVRKWAKRAGRQPRLLDYGSGKGYQYLTHRIHEAWGGILPFCYDPGVVHLAKRPTGLFDGVICVDVLEHIEERDLKDVITDVFQYVATRPDPETKVTPFIYFHVCCRPAWKHFKDGRNLHRTIKDETWWQQVIGRAAGRMKHVKVVTTYEGEPPEDLSNVDTKPPEPEPAPDPVGEGHPLAEWGYPFPGGVGEAGALGGWQVDLPVAEVDSGGDEGEAPQRGT